MASNEKQTWGEQESYFGPALVLLVEKGYIFSPSGYVSITLHLSERKRVLQAGSLGLMVRYKDEREILHEMQHPDWQGGVKIDG